MKYVIPFVAFGVLCMPLVVGAQDTGLVPACGANCNWCDFITLINNVVRWLIIFLSVIAVIVLVIAGFKMVTSGGDVSAWTSAKSMFTNVILGIIIVLAAWLIVDTGLVMLTGGGINFWLPSDCGAAERILEDRIV
ncbi:MAG: pilin [Candidatus Paceibacterota bacterium]